MVRLDTLAELERRVSVLEDDWTRIEQSWARIKQSPVLARICDELADHSPSGTAVDRIVLTRAEAIALLDLFRALASDMKVQT